MAAANVANTLIVPVESTVSPYYDDFNESKNFHRIMFRPGYPVQARELTQLQTIVQNQVERFGRHIFVNGSSVIGGKLDISDVITLNVNPEFNNTAVDITTFQGKTITYSSGNTEVVAKVLQTTPGTNVAPPAIHVKYMTGTEFGAGTTITSFPSGISANLSSSPNYSTPATMAFIYDSIYFMQGYFIKVPEQGIVISKHDRKANGKVGLEYTDSIITETSDVSLLDPALESSNYQAPGAGRYQVELVLSNRTLDSIDDEKFIEIARLENGVIRKLVKNPIYSEIEEVLARRTYDESGNYIVRPFRIRVDDSLVDPTNNYTLSISAGKAYVFGFEVENNAETVIEIPKARSTYPVNNYDMNMNYGNYVIVDHLQGTFDLTSMGVVDLHCVTPDLINYSTESSYKSTQIGTARVRDINFYGGDANTEARKFEFYFIDNKFRTIAANATTTSSNTQEIIINSSATSSANDAYTGAYITIVDGASAGDSRLITSYRGTTKTAVVTPAFTSATMANSRFEISFDITDVDAFVSSTDYTPNSSYFAAASVSLQNKDDGTYNGSTFVYEPLLNAAYFSFPNQYISPGLSDISYQYRKVYKGVQFGGGVSSVLTAGSGEVFAVPTTTANVELSVMDNVLVVVSDPAGSSRGLGEQVKVTSTVVDSVPPQLTLNSGNTSEVFTATVYVKINATNEATQPRVKTLVTSNTKVFTSSSATANFLNTTGSNTYVYLTAGQVVIQNPSPTKEESLFISDIESVSAIYGTDKMPVAGSSMVGLTDITERYTVNSGQKYTHYDHGTIKLKSGFNNPFKVMIVCLKYFNSTNDVGYFSVDSYPNLANTVYDVNGTNLGEGYSMIPKYGSLKMADTIDFRPVRPNASNNSTWLFNNVRTPVPASSFKVDYNYYLPRYDVITLSINDSINLIKGSTNKTPYFPDVPSKSLLLYRLNVLPYTMKKGDILIETLDHRRYTMEDISKIDRRLKNVEYSVSLNTLQKSATDIIIKDVNGLDRTKYGILAEDFTSHLLGDPLSPDYKCSVDVTGTFSPTGGVLMPRSGINYYKLVANTETFQNVSNHDNKITLSYRTVPAITQNTATKSVPVTSYLFAEYRGHIITVPDSDQFRDTTWLPPDVITLPEVIPYYPPPPPPDYPPPPGGTYVPPPPTGGGGGGGGVDWSKWNHIDPNGGEKKVTVSKEILMRADVVYYDAASGQLKTKVGTQQYDTNGYLKTVGMNDVQYNTTINNQLKNSGIPNPVTVPVSVTNVINDAYRQILGRPVDLGGAVGWANEAVKNGWTEAQLRAQIGYAATNLTKELTKTGGTISNINVAPATVLDSGTSYLNTSMNNTKAIEKGTTVTIVGANINTNGYQGTSVTTTPTGTTRGTDPATGKDTTTYKQGTQTNTNAPTTLANAIQGLYQANLGGSASQVEIDAWTKSNMSITQIEAQIRSSPEAKVYQSTGVQNPQRATVVQGQSFLATTSSVKTSTTAAKK